MIKSSRGNNQDTDRLLGRDEWCERCFWDHCNPTEGSGLSLQAPSPALGKLVVCPRLDRKTVSSTKQQGKPLRTRTLLCGEFKTHRLALDNDAHDFTGCSTSSKLPWDSFGYICSHMLSWTWTAEDFVGFPHDVKHWQRGQLLTPLRDKRVLDST